MITFLIGGLLILWILKMIFLSITSQPLNEDVAVDTDASA